MAKKKPKRPVRGSGISVSLPTEPTVRGREGQARHGGHRPGGRDLEYEIKLGQTIEFRVGGPYGGVHGRASGPAPDSEFRVVTNGDNAESITVEYEHALGGPQKVVLAPGRILRLNPVVSRHWKFTAAQLGMSR